MHAYAHKWQTRERSDIPAGVGREGVVPEGLIGRMDRGRQLAARFGRGLVKAMANVALDASVQFSCAHVHTLQFVVAVRSTKLEKHSPTRWAVKNAPSPSCKGASYSPLTLRVALQKFRYRRPWTSTPPPGPIRPRRWPPPLSLMAGHVGRAAGAFRRLRLPADDSPHAGGALPVQRSGHSQGRLELSAPQYLLTALHNASL